MIIRMKKWILTVSTAAAALWGRQAGKCGPGDIDTEIRMIALMEGLEPSDRFPGQHISSVPACQFAHMSVNRWSRTRTCGVSDVTVLQTAALAAGHIHLYDPQRLYPLRIYFILFFLQTGHLS